MTDASGSQPPQGGFPAASAREVPPPRPTENALLDRLAVLEEQASVVQRLSEIEQRLRGGFVQRPWWRDGKTVTILAGILAAVVPLITAVDGWVRNRGEMNRLLLEQQNRIRQEYLNRVFAPGTPEADRLRLLRLLSRIRQDEDLQDWARSETKIVQVTIDSLQRVADAAGREAAAARDSIAVLRARDSTATVGARALQFRVAELERRSAAARLRINGAVTQVGRGVDSLDVDSLVSELDQLYRRATSSTVGPASERTATATVGTLVLSTRVPLSLVTISRMPGGPIERQLSSLSVNIDEQVSLPVGSHTVEWEVAPPGRFGGRKKRSAVVTVSNGPPLVLRIGPKGDVLVGDGVVPIP